MFKCVNCGKTGGFNEEVYFIDDIFNETIVPNCSLECANTTKKKLVAETEHKLEKLKNQQIIKDSW